MDTSRQQHGLRIGPTSAIPTRSTSTVRPTQRTNIAEPPFYLDGNEIKECQELKSSPSSKIYAGMTANGTLVVIKAFASMEEFGREQVILDKIDQVSSVRDRRRGCCFLYGSDAERKYLVIEHGGLPLNDIGQVTNPLDMLLILKAASLSILEFHQNGYVHCDVTSSNFVYNLSVPGKMAVVRLIDFGFTRNRGRRAPTIYLGTRPACYDCPEFIDSAPVSNAWDYYLLGRVLDELIRGHWWTGYGSLQRYIYQLQDKSPSVRTGALRYLVAHLTTMYTSLRVPRDDVARAQCESLSVAMDTRFALHSQLLKELSSNIERFNAILGIQFSSKIESDSYLKAFVTAFRTTILSTHTAALLVQTDIISNSKKGITGNIGAGVVAVSKHCPSGISLAVWGLGQILVQFDANSQKRMVTRFATLAGEYNVMSNLVMHVVDEVIDRLDRDKLNSPSKTSTLKTVVSFLFESASDLLRDPEAPGMDSIMEQIEVNTVVSPAAAAGATVMRGMRDVGSKLHHVARQPKEHHGLATTVAEGATSLYHRFLGGGANKRLQSNDDPIGKGTLAGELVAHFVIERVFAGSLDNATNFETRLQLLVSLIINQFGQHENGSTCVADRTRSKRMKP